MKVSELIAELQKCPQDWKVILSTPYEILGETAETSIDPWDREVRDVCVNDKLSTEHKDYQTVELDNWPAEGFLK